MKICDVTQFYSPRSGGVKRYLHEKIAYIENVRAGDEHVLVFPSARTQVERRPRSRIYGVASPVVSRSSGYRALLDLRAVEEIMV